MRKKLVPEKQLRQPKIKADLEVKGHENPPSLQVKERRAKDKEIKTNLNGGGKKLRERKRKRQLSAKSNCSSILGSFEKLWYPRCAGLLSLCTRESRKRGRAIAPTVL